MSTASGGAQGPDPRGGKAIIASNRIERYIARVIDYKDEDPIESRAHAVMQLTWSLLRYIRGSKTARRRAAAALRKLSLYCIKGSPDDFNLNLMADQLFKKTK